MGLINKTAKQYYDSTQPGKNGGYDPKVYGDYQFVSLDRIVNQFIIAYVGEDNIIPKIKKTAVQFHAMRALQELSFDTLKSVKSIEVEVPPSLSLPLPQDYVNYVKLTFSDTSGIEHILYPTSKTSNPFAIKQNSDGTYDFDYNDNGVLDMNELSHENTKHKFITQINVNSTEITLGGFSPQSQMNPYAIDDDTFDLEVGMFVISEHFPHGTKITAITSGAGVPANGGIITVDNASLNDVVVGPVFPGEILFSNDLVETSTTLRNFKSHTSSTTSIADDYEDDSRWYAEGRRYGIDPQHAQDNGTYFIDERQGRIFFSSALNEKNIILKYISDSLGTDEEMQVHKFAEEAMYKCIAYGIMSTRANVQEYMVRRLQKDKFAAVRKAKLRLSNLKLEELTQILRGKSKHIKH